MSCPAGRLLSVFGFGSAAMLAALLSHGGVVNAGDPAAECASLAQASFGRDIGVPVSVTRAQYVTSGVLPAYCQLAAVIAPAVRVIVRLPATGWSQRLLVAGCGGLCGSLHIESADDALARGYVTATTDMGHDADAGTAWRSNPAALEDFTQRATHLATLLAKVVVKAYYGRDQSHSYFRGCSTGGRQGLMEALRYPEDFDGIVAGAPASYPTVQIQLWDRQINRRPDDREILDASAMRLLHDAALKVCDAVDGVRDGLISNPLGCHFDPATLQCHARARGNCLTAEQVRVAREFYAGPRAAADGPRLTTLGMAPGSEAGVAANIVSIDGKPPAVDAVLENFAQILLRPTASWHEFKVDGNTGRESPVDGIPEAAAATGALLPFAGRHGKLLMYTGWIDPLVSPTVAIDFYRRGVAELGPGGDASMRLFMLPGMSHCRGGDGPDTVDWLAAIEGWVEHAAAPQSLMSYKMAAVAAGEAAYRFPLPADRVLYARPLYPFPAYAHYTGRGAAGDPASFEPRNAAGTDH